MRQFLERFVSLLTVLLAALALAHLADAQTLPDPDPQETQVDRFQLHQSFKACGKKWLKKAKRLTPEQLDWMMRREHRLYKLAAGGRTVMTLELLSTTSFRGCDLETAWSARETTVRVTYFEEDGSRATRLHSFAKDGVFFDRQPTFYAGMGKALLRGVTLDGTKVSRWLPLDRLPSMVATVQAPAPPVVVAQIADTGVAGGL